MATLTDTVLGVLRYPLPASAAAHPAAEAADLAALAAEKGRPLSVAVARFDGIGDWVLTLPLVSALAASPAVADLAVVAPAPWRGLLDRGVAGRFVPYGLGTILAPPPPGGVLGKVRAVAWPTGRAARAAGARDAGGVDVVVLPRWDTDLGSNARAWAAGTGAVLLGFDPAAVPGTTRRERRERRLLTAPVADAAPATHEIEHLRLLMDALGLGTDVRPGYGAEYFGVPRVADAEQPYVVVHALSNEPKRQWPPQRWREVAAALTRDHDVDVVLIGSAAERDRLGTIAEGLGPRVRVQAGQPLAELPALLAAADSFVGNDSGPMHVAASLGVPVVAVSPHPEDGDPAHRNSPVRFGPWGVRTQVLRPATGLDRCRAGCVARTPHCITAVSVDQVLAAVGRVRGA